MSDYQSKLFKGMSFRIESLVIESGSYKEEWIVELNPSCFSNLRLLGVGTGCFPHVRCVKMIGMKLLESVVIGNSCFNGEEGCYGASEENSSVTVPSFFLNDCPVMRELKIGCSSFLDYSICKIERMNSLEVIEISNSDWHEYSFKYASLELRSDNPGMELSIGLPNLKSAYIGCNAFYNGSHAVFESEQYARGMMNRLTSVDFYSM